MAVNLACRLASAGIHPLDVFGKERFGEAAHPGWEVLDVIDHQLERLFPCLLDAPIVGMIPSVPLIEVCTKLGAIQVVDIRAMWTTWLP